MTMQIHPAFFEISTRSAFAHVGRYSDYNHPALRGDHIREPEKMRKFLERLAREIFDPAALEALLVDERLPVRTWLAQGPKLFWERKFSPKYRKFLAGEPFPAGEMEEKRKMVKRRIFYGAENVGHDGPLLFAYALATGAEFSKAMEIFWRYQRYFQAKRNQYGGSTPKEAVRIGRPLYMEVCPAAFSGRILREIFMEEFKISD